MRGVKTQKIKTICEHCFTYAPTLREMTQINFERKNQRHHTVHMTWQQISKQEIIPK